MANLLLVVVLLLILAFVVLRKAFLFHKKQKNITLPPSPQKLPIIGHLHLLGRFPHRSLHALSLTHGPLIHLKLGKVLAIIVSSPAIAREVLTDHDLSFAGRPTVKTFRRLSYNFRSVGSAPYGEYWRQVRKICVLHLLSARRVQSFRPVREEEVARMLQKVRQASCIDNKTVNLSKGLGELAYAVIHRAALGRKCSDERESQVLQGIIQEVSTLIGTFNVEDYFPSLWWLSVVTGFNRKLNKTFKKLDEFVDGVLQRHMADRVSGGDGEDFVDVLLALNKDETNADFTLTKEDIKALVMNMFSAGIGTTHTFLSWAMSELIRNPNVMEKLQRQVRSTAGKKEGLVTEEDIMRIPYLKAVIKEVLRLHPSAPLLLPHQAIEPTELLGYQIPAKTRVIVNAWAIGRDPHSWDLPEEFMPERFITNSSIDFRGSDFQYIPFGGGRRICPGIHFALATVELVLANLVYHFNWKLPGDMRAQDLNMEETPGLTTLRKYELILVAEPACM